MLGAGAPGAMDEGQNLDQQISDGVQAFVNSGDPAIAVEVVNMLAQQMGLAPEQDFFSDQAADPMASAPATAGVPAARNGVKIYRNGGKIKVVKKLQNGGVATKKKMAVGGPTDPYGRNGNQGTNATLAFAPTVQIPNALNPRTPSPVGFNTVSGGSVDAAARRASLNLRNDGSQEDLDRYLAAFPDRSAGSYFDAVEVQDPTLQVAPVVDTPPVAPGYIYTGQGAKPGASRLKKAPTSNPATRSRSFRSRR